MQQWSGTESCRLSVWCMVCVCVMCWILGHRLKNSCRRPLWNASLWGLFTMWIEISGELMKHLFFFFFCLNTVQCPGHGALPGYLPHRPHHAGHCCQRQAGCKFISSLSRGNHGQSLLEVAQHFTLIILNLSLPLQNGYINFDKRRRVSVAIRITLKYERLEDEYIICCSAVEISMSLSLADDLIMNSFWQVKQQNKLHFLQH